MRASFCVGRFLWLLGLWLGSAVSLSATDLRGWVKDSVTGAPVEGASVGLDLEPPDGQNEYQRNTTTFGFFRIGGVRTGTYQLTISRPGYNPQQSQVVIGSDTRRATYSLVPLPGGPGFDIYAQVGDVTTGSLLTNIPLAALQYHGSNDMVPQAVFTAYTDTNGFAAFRGLSNGYYLFRANSTADGTVRGGWLAFTNLATTNLHRSYMAGILLKPTPQALSVQVAGFDPVLLSIGPLTNFVVELTGLDPRDTNAVVVPVRAGLTDGSGAITNSGLPSCLWHVKTKGMGYSPAEQWIGPGPDGLLTTTNVVLNPPFQTNVLQITLTSPYNPGQYLLYYNVPVVVQGLTNTATEGIVRVLNNRSFFDPPHIRYGTNFPPGIYHIFVRGPATTNTFYPVQPDFIGDDYVQMLPGSTTTVTLNLDVLRATVHGRLLAADALGEIGLAAQYDQRKPIYQPRQQTGVEIVEFGTDHLLPTNANVISVDTDETGEFSVSLLPARYGIRIPSMTNYWGSHMEMTNATTGASLQEGWPFCTNWPFSGQPPANGTTHAGLPLVFQTNDDYTLDLFVRRQLVVLGGVVYQGGPPPADNPPPELFYAPTEALAIHIDSAAPLGAGSFPASCQDVVFGGCTATLTPAGGPGRTVSLTQPPDTVDHLGLPPQEYEFTGVSPGNYTLNISVPRQTVSNYDSGLGTYSPLPAALYLPPWNPPGILPDSDPAGSVAPLTQWYPVNAYAFYPLLDTIVRMQTYTWMGTNYELTGSVAATNYVDTSMPIDFWSPAYVNGDIFFAAHSLSGFGLVSMVMPASDFTIWSYLGNSNWFTASVTGGADNTLPIYVGGPDNNIDSPAPQPSYDLTLLSVSDDDPTYTVPGTTITIGGNTFAMTNQTIGNFQGNYVGTVQNAHWNYVRTEVGITNIGAIPSVFNRSIMQRGIGVRGSVTNNATGAPLPGAQIRLLTRYGAPLESVTTLVDGSFVFPTALSNASTAFVEIAAPGFVPWRQRFAPGDAVTDPNVPSHIDYIANAALAPLPQPAIQSVSLDRVGLFLPGVKKQGVLDATNALTMTWTARVQLVTTNITLPDYDKPDGSPSGAAGVDLTDLLSDVWFIDARSFPSNIYNDTPITLTIPDTNNIPGVLAWLAAIRSGAVTNVFHQVLTTFQPTEDTNDFLASGQIQIWKLPPGIMNPVVVAVTRHGPVVFLTNGFYPSGSPPLQGARLPPWMASATDIIGVTAGIQATEDQLKDYLPEGRFLPLPDFAAQIEAQNNGTLNYAYTMGVNWEEGMETPDSGMLSLGSSELGLEFSAQLTFGLDGNSQDIYLKAASTAQSANIDLTKRLPAWAQTYSDVKGQFSVTAGTLAAQHYGPANDYQYTLTHEVMGDFGLDATVDLQPVTSRLPYVGPVLYLLQDSGAVTINATLGGGVGMDSQLTWRTLFPPSKASDSPEPDQVLRRDFIGGTEGLSQFSGNLTLCFNLYAGLHAGLINDNIGATGKIVLTGNEGPCSGEPSVTVVPNALGDWPVLKRVSGNVTASLEAYCKILILDLDKTWNWPLINFDHQFGTTADFQLIPLDISFASTLPINNGPVAFHGGNPALMDALFPAGSLSAASAPAGYALLFTDVDTNNGYMTLKVSLFTTNGTWTVPVVVTEAPGIVASAIVQLPGTTWMAAWTELSLVDVSNPYPPTTIKFSQSDLSGTNWTAPAPIVALADVADRLELTAGPSLVGLVFTDTGDGPSAESWSLQTANWDGATWSPPNPLATNISVAAFDVAQNTVTNPPSAVVAQLDGFGLSQSFPWTGQTNGGFDAVSSGAGRSLSLAAAPAGKFYLLQSTIDGGIALLNQSLTNDWTNLAAIASNALPSEVHLTTLSDAASFCLLATWGAGSDVTTIHAAFLDPSGAFLGNARTFTTNTVGRYHDLHVLPAGDKTATLIARYTTGGNGGDSVQVFTVTLNLAPLLENPGFDPGLGFGFDFFGAPGVIHLIQSSSNLASWADLQSVIGSNAPIRVHDSTAPNSSSRFYRAIIP